MSQEKCHVTRKKKQTEKTNELKKRKEESIFFRKCVVGIVALGLVGWIGYSAYSMYESSRPRQTAEVDYSAIDSYIDSLNGTETE